MESPLVRLKAKLLAFYFGKNASPAHMLMLDGMCGNQSVHKFRSRLIFHRFKGFSISALLFFFFFLNIVSVY